jgi:Fic family protein
MPSTRNPGRFVPTIGGAMAFVPDPLPPKLDLQRLIGRIAEASTMLGALNANSVLIPNPDLIIAPLQRREALVSSRMEGTFSDAANVVLAEEAEENEIDPSNFDVSAHEVYNAMSAIRYALRNLETIPVSSRLIRGMHGRLMAGLPAVRAGGGVPGEFKTSQNWIGKKGDSIASARYVPPPPLETVEAMSSLEKFIHDDAYGELTPLVHAALIHYQFEAIHPFADGNGRIGRLLVPVILMARGALNAPVLFLSSYLEDTKDEYMDRMLAVSRDGAWEDWIGYFLLAIIESAKRTQTVTAKLLEWRRTAEGKLRAKGIKLDAIVILDRLLARPAITVRQIQKTLQAKSYNTAKTRCEDLVAAGILRPFRRSTFPQMYEAPELLDIIDARS